MLGITLTLVTSVYVVSVIQKNPRELWKPYTVSLTEVTHPWMGGGFAAAVYQHMETQSRIGPVLQIDNVGRS